MASKNGRACVGCRNMKVRCVPDPGGGSGACMRCQRLRIECDFSRKKPGRKTMSEIPDAPSESSAPNALTTMGTSSSGIGWAAWDAFLLNSAPTLQGDIPPLGPVQTQASGVVEAQSSGRSAASTNTRDLRFAPDDAHRFPGDGKSVASLNVADHLDPAWPNGEPDSIGGPSVAAESRTREAASQGGQDDLLIADFVSELEMRTLVDFFFRSLNPVIAILDPKLHTQSVIRRESGILFISILTVSAKFSRPAIYPLLLAHAQAVLSRAIIAGECKLSLVQALLIIVHWKDPTDKSAWVKLGIAIRLGYQLDLHVVRHKPLPADEVAARKVRAAERTWLVLSCIDRAYSELFKLPPTIRLEELANPEGWARERADLQSTDDLHLASAVAMASGQMMWTKLRQDRSHLSMELRLFFLRDLYARYSQHRLYWFPADISRRMFPDTIHRSLSWYDINHLFMLKFEMIQCSSPFETSNLVQECLVLADEYAVQTELMGTDGSLRYLQDTSAAQLSSFGVVSYKLFWMLDPDRRRLLDSLLRKIQNACRNTAGGDENAITAFIARFFQRVLSTISVESRRGSTAGSPLLSNAQNQVPQPDFNFYSDFDMNFNEQEDLLRILSMPIDNSHVDDDLYWLGQTRPTAANEPQSEIPFYLR